MSIEINPRRLKGGPWADGYALDRHTLGSTYIGDNQFGKPMFDTQRSPAGELLYQLKYRQDKRPSISWPKRRQPFTENGSRPWT